MRKHRLIAIGAALLLLPSANCIVRAADSVAISETGSGAPPSVPAQEEPEILTRGPVHEAFAEPVTLQVDEGIIASKQPPVIINETPPIEKPAGSNYVWVPGYWSWDNGRDSYIWISGCWRVAPPKMCWVPGYWTRISVGWKWVSGFWMQVGTKEIEYLNAPPAPVEVEPVGTPPTAYSIWVPGCWYWVNGKYVLRSGYWLEGQPDWVWIPSHYVWTPRGYVFSRGHWDHVLERRGILYAPVYFPSSVVYTRPGYRFTLGVTVDLGLLKVNLFCYPRYSHYYFGDYYDDAFIRIGIFPCYESVRRHAWFDPIYQYDRWHSRDPHWDDHARHSYELRRNDRDLRPPRTYREQESHISRLPEAKQSDYRIIRAAEPVQQSKSAPVKNGKSDDDARQKISKQSRDVQNYREERRQWESTDTYTKGIKYPSNRVSDEVNRTNQSSDNNGGPAVKTDRGQGTGNVSAQKLPERSNSATQTEHGKEGASKGVQPYSDRCDYSGRSERVRIPDSPVADRSPSYSGSERYPSMPSEEGRGQDNWRDSRRDDGQRGGRSNR